MENQELEHRYLIPEYSLPALEARFERLAQKARRHGSTGVKLHTQPAEPKIHADGTATPMYYVKVLGESPKIEGYKLLGVISHGVGPGGTNLLSSFGANRIPGKYKNASSICEHCHVARKRNLTYVIQDNDGRIKQIGTSCLDDYLVGVNASDRASILSAGEMLSEALTVLDELDEGNREKQIYLQGYLEQVAETAMRFKKWVSAKEAKEKGEMSTAQIALDMLSIPEGEDTYGGNVAPRESARALVKQALKWIRELPKQKEQYLEKLRLLCKEEVIEVRSTGMAATLITVYQQKHLGSNFKSSKEIQKKQDREVSWDANKYQQMVAKMPRPDLNPREQALFLAVKLGAATSQLTNEISKSVEENQEMDEKVVIKEAGDMAWYLTVLLDVYGLSLTEVLEFNVKRLLARYPELNVPDIW
jgi:NTP pyrophosphatase (non-canonical NTP hydrolase)